MFSRKLLLTLISAWLSCLSGLCQDSDTTTIVSSIGVTDTAIITDLNAIAAESGKVILSWKLVGPVPEFFNIERSENNLKFEAVMVLTNLEKKPVYLWIDDAPKKTRSYYRIRYAFKNAEDLYSQTVSIVVPGSNEIKFYPNPVDHLLIVRSESPVDVQITDGNGRIRISENKVSGLHTINVSTLEKGIYLIRFSNKLTNVMFQEKLIKN